MNREYIVTRHVEIMKAKDNEISYYKLFIYGKPVSFGPYELKGDLKYSPKGVDSEIDELINKLNNKKWLVKT